MTRLILPLTLGAVLALAACEETTTSGGASGGSGGGGGQSGSGLSIVGGPDGTVQGTFNPENWDSNDIVGILRTECPNFGGYAEAQGPNGSTAFRAQCQ